MRRFQQKLAFYLECLNRAGRGKFLTVETISGILALVAMPISQLWQPAQPYLNWIPLALFVSMFLGSILLGAVTAPYWIAKELEDENENIRLKLDNKEARQNALNVLWKLRSEGIAMRNEPLVSENEVGPWKAKMNEWRDKVLVQAGIVNENLRSYLERLDRTEPIPVNIFPRNGDHELTLRIMSEVLRRMETYLTRELR